MLPYLPFPASKWFAFFGLVPKPVPYPLHVAPLQQGHHKVALCTHSNVSMKTKHIATSTPTHATSTPTSLTHIETTAVQLQCHTYSDVPQPWHWLAQSTTTCSTDHSLPHTYTTPSPVVRPATPRPYMGPLCVCYCWCSFLPAANAPMIA